MSCPKRLKNSLSITSAAELHQKELTASPRQSPPKSAKKACTIVPAPQAARIMQRHIRGESIRQIAREEKRDRETVTKIVRSDEMQTHVQKMREEFFGLAEDAMATVRRALKESSDGRLAYQILRDSGVIPTPEQVFALQQKQASSVISDSDPVKLEYLKFCSVAYDMEKAFEQPLAAAENPKTSKLTSGQNEEKTD